MSQNCHLDLLWTTRQVIHWADVAIDQFHQAKSIFRYLIDLNLTQVQQRDTTAKASANLTHKSRLGQTL